MVDGEYTTKSTYCIQFQRTFSKLKIMPIWKAKAEPKCNFFAWTLMHKKILTANNLMKHYWPNDPICKLCGSDPETLTHLCKDCVFSKQSLIFFKTVAWFINDRHSWIKQIIAQLFGVDVVLTLIEARGKCSTASWSIFGGMFERIRIEELFRTRPCNQDKRKKWSSTSWRQDQRCKSISHSCIGFGFFRFLSA
jgi:hypothetical protein